uniref:hypothetical protein n=1 Tax=Cryobacterium sp. TaxID=1926290 RepID=UPI001597FB4C|nr:hypothetical protein [Cryobacterium sp.]QJS06291.1 hypothetical protein [Cryobacterium sp.]
MIAPSIKALILEQCLPILITKSSDKNVVMDRMSVPATAMTGDEQLQKYQEEFVHRRLLAEVPDLIKILQDIGQKASWQNRLEHRRDQMLRGRLDVSQYIRDKRRPVERPRTFPLIIQERQFDTPENRLAAGVLGSVRLMLANEVFPTNTAESILARSHFRTLTKYSRNDVFSAGRKSSFTRKDLALARFRVARRMTGNDGPYRQLLDWIDDWLSLAGLSDGSDNDRALDLALPSSDAYWEKIFEVWCLEQVRASLIRVGWATESSFRLHAARNTGPIAQFTKNQQVVDVYFQRQAPMGKGRWLDVSTQNALVGIIDVALSRPGTAPLLIDAKFRFKVLKASTSEEQYKMLGYAENFAHSQPSSGSFGLLVFPSDIVDRKSYSRGEFSRLTTLRTDLRSDLFAAYFDEEIKSWLKD